MIEKEIKVLNYNRIIDLEQFLISRKAELIKDELQRNIIFSDDGKQTLKMRYTFSYLTKSGSSEIIIKQQVKNSDSNAKVKEETTIPLTREQFDSTLEILDKIYPNKVLDSGKQRRTYKYKGFLFELDTWDKDVFPRSYLEIEAIDPNVDIQMGLDIIWSREDQKKLVITTDGIVDLMNKYKKYLEYYNIFNKINLPE